MRCARMLPTAATLAAMIVAGSTGPPAKGQDPATAKARVKFTQEQIRRLADESKAVEARIGVDPRAANPFAGHPILGRLAIQDVPPGDPHQAVVARLRMAMTQSCAECHAGGVSVRDDDLLGLTLVPADETLRDQLKLDGRGLVVTSVAKGSAGEAGGIKEKDILLTAGAKPLATVDALKAAVEEARPKPGVGEKAPAVLRVKPITIGLVRAGELKEVPVAPFPRTVVVGRVGGQVEATATTPPRYWIGVGIGQVDATLGSHLKLAEGTGLVVTDVIEGSPARKAGLRKNDVLVSIDGAALKAPEDMIKIVQGSGDTKPLAIKLRRAGAEVVAEVRPEKRKEPQAAAANAPGVTPPPFPQSPWVVDVLPFLDQGQVAAVWTMPTRNTNLLLHPDGGAQPLHAQLKALEGQLKEVKAAVDELKEAIKKEKGR